MMGTFPRTRSYAAFRCHVRIRSSWAAKGGWAARSRITKSWLRSTRRCGTAWGGQPALLHHSSSPSRHGRWLTPMRFPQDLAAMLSAFGAARVRYLIVGGHAVGVHARPRTTKDLDLWLDAAPKNIERACNALAAFGAPASIVDALRTASSDAIAWMGAVPPRVDV